MDGTRQAFHSAKFSIESSRKSVMVELGINKLKETSTQMYTPFKVGI